MKRFANPSGALFAFTRCASLAAFLVVGSLANAAESGLIKLKAPLDEPEFYCLDVPGFRARLNLEAPLMAHTCKPGADDEIYQLDHPGKGQLSMPAYDLCVQADNLDVGGQVRMKECSDDPLQKFEWADGRIRPSENTKLCLSVADAKGEPTGGPSHLKLDLTLQTCADVPGACSEWLIP